MSLKAAAQCKICRSRGPERCKLLLWTELKVLVILHFHLHDVFFDARKVVAKAQWHTSQCCCNSEFCGCRCFQIHVARLRERGDYAEPVLLQSLERADTCIQHNRDNPGFFDMAISSGKKLHGIHPSKQGNVFLFRRSNFYFIFLTIDDLSDAYKRLKRLIMEYLGMSPPSTVHSDLFSGSMTSVDTSQSEDTLHQADKSGTSQTTSITVNMAARTWSRPSDSSTLPSKGIKLKQHRTPVVREVLHVNIFYFENNFLSTLSLSLGSSQACRGKRQL